MAIDYKISDYDIGWICAIPIELEAVLTILDEEHPTLDGIEGDSNLYKYGRIGKHNIVISWLPSGVYGITQAGIVAANMNYTFKLRFSLMVGIGGGVPTYNDIRLGDIVISQPTGNSGGVIQYDYGKAMENGIFVRTGSLNAPPTTLLRAVTALKAMNDARLSKSISQFSRKIGREIPKFKRPARETDKLFRAEWKHVVSGPVEDENVNCEMCESAGLKDRLERKHDDPSIHYGVIASANQLMKDGVKRDIIGREIKALCFEMEAAALMNDFRCLIVRGICDYSDGHKNKRWQPYAALVAAIYARELLFQIPKGRDETERTDFDVPFCMNMPFPRNRAFVGRQKELGDIDRYFKDSISGSTPALFALVGVGGMGKTQTALEYAYRHQQDYRAIFWIDGASEENIHMSLVDVIQCIVEHMVATFSGSIPDYRSIGIKLGIPDLIDNNGKISSNPKQISRIISASLRWFRQHRNGRWLLIFDNVDDLESFEIQKYIPKQGNGAVFITSRRTEFSYAAEEILLDELDKKSASELLLHISKKKMGSKNDIDAEELVEKLGYMPLAITQAAHYLRETRGSVRDYLHLYDKSFMKLQSRRPKFGWNYRNETVTTTWEISFQEVERQNPFAALILLMSSYMKPQEIMIYWWNESFADQIQNEAPILLLASYSLIKLTLNGAYSVHPVVHMWARQRLDRSEHLKVAEHAIKVLARAAMHKGGDQYNADWTRQEHTRIIAHVEHLKRYITSSDIDLFIQGPQGQVILDSLYHIAAKFCEQGKVTQAVEFYKQILWGREMTPGYHDPSSLDAASVIVSCLTNQKRYVEAVSLNERTIRGYENAYGNNHPSLFYASGHMVLLLLNQNKDEEAKFWTEKTLSVQEKDPGENQLAKAATIGHFGAKFHDHGNYQKAEELYKRAFFLIKGALGINNPTILASVDALTDILTKQGKYNEANEWFMLALNRKEAIWGRAHKSTLCTIVGSAMVMAFQKRYNEAVQLLKSALPDVEKALGKDCFFTLSLLNNIAAILCNQKNYNQGMQWYNKALSRTLDTADHNEMVEIVVTRSINIGMLLEHQEKHAEANQWYNRAQATYKGTLGTGDGRLAHVAVGIDQIKKKKTPSTFIYTSASSCLTKGFPPH